jgi:diacylglycerol kinase (ATP)
MVIPVRTACIVVTPGSGEGRGRFVAHRLARLLRRQGRAVTRQRFDDLGALERWARTAGPGYDLLLCVGGDATQSAAAVFARRHRIPFVPVPVGFGNLFASVFGHPGSPAGVMALLRDGQVHQVDVGEACDEMFLSHRSYGFLHEVQQQLERGAQPRRRALRLLAYHWTAVRAVATAPLRPQRLEIDGAVVAEDAVLITVANVETYRGFLSLTPSASPIDGRFDVFALPRTGKLGLFWRLLKLRLRLPGRWRGVGLYRGRVVRVSGGTRDETLRVARRALPVLMPPGAIEALRRRRTEDEAAAVEPVPEPAHGLR